MKNKVKVSGHFHMRVNWIQISPCNLLGETECFPIFNTFQCQMSNNNHSYYKGKVDKRKISINVETFISFSHQDVKCKVTELKSQFSM